MIDKVTDIVEGVWLKGAARISGIVLMLIGVPLVLAVTKRTYEAIGSIDLNQARLTARIELIVLTMDHDRASSADRDAQVAKLLEQRLDNIEYRLDEIDKRLVKP